MKINPNQNELNHRAKLISQWKCLSENKLPRNISIAEFESCDVEFIQKLRTSFDQKPMKDEVRQEIVSSALMTIEGLLSTDCGFLDKVKMLVAIQNYRPCGLLIANMPKRMSSTEGVNYSSRHNNAKNETEIDWLATWVPDGAEKLKGIGKALVGEYFLSLKQSRFRDVFVKSELPENSYAQSFYESLGFEVLGTKRQTLETKTSKEYLVSNHANSADRVVPMIITRGRWQACIDDLTKKMFRQRFIKTSVNANDLMNI